LRLYLLRIVKKFDSIRTKLTEEINFEVCLYGDSSNGTAAAAWSARDILIEPAAQWWRDSELGAQSGRKNQPASYLFFL